MPNEVTYKVFSYTSVSADKTTIDLTGIENKDRYSHIRAVLMKRFKDYNITINHSSRTVSIDELKAK